MTQHQPMQFKSARCICILLALPFATLAQDVIAPPSLGQETKGAPTIIEQQSDSIQTSAEVDSRDSAEKNSDYGLLGHTEINEQRRENGHVYRIELKHSSGSTQYIDEDSDGKLESSNNDIEKSPNLAKWRIGSW